MNRFTVIQKLSEAINARTYLEIGVNTGEIFFAVNVPYKIAVDPHFKFSGRARLHRMPIINKLIYKNNEHFFEETSDEFFAVNSGLLETLSIDIAFVDGLHTFHQSYKDIMNCLKYLSPQGVVVVHDTNPISPAFETPVFNSIDEVLNKAKNGEIPGWTGNWSGDVWKAIVKLQCEQKDLNISTLDLDWGVTIIARGNNPNRLPIKNIDELSYKDLMENRIKWLNLKDPHFLEEILLGLKRQ